MVVGAAGIFSADGESRVFLWHRRPVVLHIGIEVVVFSGLTLWPHVARVVGVGCRAEPSSVPVGCRVVWGEGLIRVLESCFLIWKVTAEVSAAAERLSLGGDLSS